MWSEFLFLASTNVAIFPLSLSLSLCFFIFSLAALRREDAYSSFIISRCSISFVYLSFFLSLSSKSKEICVSSPRVRHRISFSSKKKSKASLSRIPLKSDFPLEHLKSLWDWTFWSNSLKWSKVAKGGGRGKISILELATLVFRYWWRKGEEIHIYGKGESLWDDILRLSDNWIKSSEGMNWEEKKEEQFW